MTKIAGFHSVCDMKTKGSTHRPGFLSVHEMVTKCDNDPPPDRPGFTGVCMMTNDACPTPPPDPIVINANVLNHSGYAKLALIVDSSFKIQEVAFPPPGGIYVFGPYPVDHPLVSLIMENAGGTNLQTVSITSHGTLHKHGELHVTLSTP